MICPTCKRTFDPNTPNASTAPAAEGNAGQRRPLPFCSARCRLADLGNWLDGSFRIPAETDDQDLDTVPPADELPSGSDPLN